MDRIQPQLALLFPGVGSQHTLMAKSFYDSSAAARAIFEEASDELGIDLLSICFDEAQATMLNRTDMAQLALFTATMAIYRVFEQESGLTADWMAGHSMGEYSALCASGALSFAAALRLLRDRASIIQHALRTVEGTMMWVINVELSAVEELCQLSRKSGKPLYISAYDSPTQCSVSGSESAVMSIVKPVEQLGGIVYPLKLAGPFHSPLMQGAADEMRKRLRDVALQPPHCRVVANATGLPYEGADTIADQLADQLRSPVQWLRTIRLLEEKPGIHFVEIGPKDVLKFLVRKTLPDARVFSCNDYKALEALQKQWMVSQEQWMSIYEGCLRLSLGTRNRNLDLSDYESVVVRPYKEAERYYLSVRAGERELTQERLLGAIRMTGDILKAKQVPQAQVYGKLAALIGHKFLPITNLWR